MRRAIALSLVVILASEPALAAAPKGWSIAKPPPPVVHHAVLMSDSAYAALSAMPVDSLSQRQYDLLMRERELQANRAAQGSAMGKGFAITAGILGALLIFGLIFGNHGG